MNVLKESNHTAMLEGSFITLSVVSTDGACGGGVVASKCTGFQNDF